MKCYACGKDLSISEGNAYALYCGNKNREIDAVFCCSLECIEKEVKKLQGKEDIEKSTQRNIKTAAIITGVNLAILIFQILSRIWSQ